MVESIYHLFVPWDDYNTMWVCLLAVWGFVRLNEKILQYSRRRNLDDFDPFE